MDVCMAVYWYRADDNVFETFLKTFRKVNKTAELVVYSDDLPRAEWPGEYDLQWVKMLPGQVNGRRCRAKMECVSGRLEQLEDGDRLLVSDIDVYFLKDPFAVFDREFDVGVTKRLESDKNMMRGKLPGYGDSERHIVNAGVFFVVAGDYTRRIFSWQFDAFAKKHPHESDWYVDQHYLGWLWKNGVVGVVDIGEKYNFCPCSFVHGISKAKQLIRNAYKERAVSVLHLKSHLKMEIYEGYLKDAVTKHKGQDWNWQQNANKNFDIQTQSAHKTVCQYPATHPADKR